jgi:RNA polymerase sigma-70 factor (ECF subfamily)
VKLWDKRKELQIQSIKGYLMVAVRNQCHNELKHQQVDKKFQQSVHFEETDAEAEFPDEEVMSRIYAVIEQMPEQRRKIFKMNRLDGMKYKEIAAALHLSPKTVEVQIGHALKFLRENLSSLKTRIYHHN